MKQHNKALCEKKRKNFVERLVMDKISNFGSNTLNNDEPCSPQEVTQTPDMKIRHKNGLNWIYRIITFS